MDTELLVDEHIEDGRKLLAELVRSGFDVTAAFWVKTSEEGIWHLYIVSNKLDGSQHADAYRAAYAAITRLGPSSISFSELKLVAPGNPIALDAQKLRPRLSANTPGRFAHARLGSVSADEVYLYPKIDGHMTSAEVLQAISALMNRMGTIKASDIALRDGSTVRAIPVGIKSQHPGRGVTVVLHLADTGAEREVPLEDITRIQ
jgi:hypothetical protein